MIAVYPIQILEPMQYAEVPGFRNPDVYITVILEEFASQGTVSGRER